MGCKNYLIRLITLLFVAGCVSSGPQEQHYEHIKIPRKWEPLTEGSRIFYDLNHIFYPSELKLNNGIVLLGWQWDLLLKDYVESFPPEKRHDIIDGFIRFNFEFDKVDKTLKYNPLDKYTYGHNSYISMKRRFDRQANGLVKMNYVGDGWIVAK
ncbi:hypothetical protein [Nitrosomonas communis]|uniref:hypothetical protein n=1 Tax=Nitrosomonas communis TaxID=44574 RepID=UPI0026E97416|nr:hypothetical protein [Nitrosomonas communis]MCO6427543.1 hypothetical protein [Nitrosomonas communis]